MPHFTFPVGYVSHPVSLFNKKLFFSNYYVKIPDYTRLNRTQFLLGGNTRAEKQGKKAGGGFLERAALSSG